MSAPTLGRRGSTEIADRVVEKIIAQAVAEVDGADVTTGRVGRRAQVSVNIDGHLVTVRVRMGVRWPEPVRVVTRTVRTQIRQRVAELTGLEVAEVDIDVTVLTSGSERRRRGRVS